MESRIYVIFSGNYFLVLYERLLEFIFSAEKHGIYFH